jgi:hypothetical protein
MNNDKEEILNEVLLNDNNTSDKETLEKWKINRDQYKKFDNSSIRKIKIHEFYVKNLIII